MKIIDTHIHIFEKPYSDLFDNSHIKDGAEGELHLFEEYRKKYDVEAAFIICYDEGHCPENSAYVQSLTETCKWIYSFGYVCPGAKNFFDKAGEIITQKHFGISCYLKKEEDAEWLNSVELTPVWDCLQDCNIPLSLTIWAEQCVNLKRLLLTHPELTILINHIGRPRLENGVFDYESYKNVLVLSEFKNIYVKLSGFYAFSEKGWSFPQRDLFLVLKLLHENFGAERLMFASDFSPVLEYNTYRQALELLQEEELGFSASELKKVYHGNAMKMILGRKRYGAES